MTFFKQNRNLHVNQPYDESLEIPDSEEVASQYTPTPRVDLRKGKPGCFPPTVHLFSTPCPPVYLPLSTCTSLPSLVRQFTILWPPVYHPLFTSYHPLSTNLPPLVHQTPTRFWLVCQHSSHQFSTIFPPAPHHFVTSELPVFPSISYQFTDARLAWFVSQLLHKKSV